MTDILTRLADPETVYEEDEEGEWALVEAAAQEIRELRQRVDELGEMYHKRGNDIAVLKHENKKLRQALLAISKIYSPEVGHGYYQAVKMATEALEGSTTGAE